MIGKPDTLPFSLLEDQSGEDEIEISPIDFGKIRNLKLLYVVNKLKVHADDL